MHPLDAAGIDVHFRPPGSGAPNVQGVLIDARDGTVCGVRAMQTPAVFFERVLDALDDERRWIAEHQTTPDDHRRVTAQLEERLPATDQLLAIADTGSDARVEGLTSFRVRA